jgi:hypothetical protein
MLDFLLNIRMPSAGVSTFFFIGLLWSGMVFMTWLMVGSTSYNLWVINDILLTQPEVLTILDYKEGLIDFQKAVRLISRRNPTLSYEQIDFILR